MRGMSDVIGSAPVLEPGEPVRVHRQRWHTDPLTLALTTFPLALVVLMGAQPFRGLAYTSPFAPSLIEGFGGENSSASGYLVTAGFLSAGFSLIPLLLARRGSRFATTETPIWIRAMLTSAALIAGLSLVLRLVQAVIVATSPLSGVELQYSVG